MTKNSLDLNNAISELNFEFAIDKHNREVYERLRLYFTRDKLFEQDGMSLEKGIMLQGRIGSGKTVMMEIFKGAGRYSMLRCNEVSMGYAVEGASIFGRYSDHTRCFDDIGSEPDTKHYGSSANIIREVMQRRAHQFTTKGLITHATTNLTGKEIKLRYGDRILSRLQEMCNVLILGQPSSPDRRQTSKPKPLAKPEPVIEKSRQEVAQGLVDALTHWVCKNKRIPYVWDWDTVYWLMKERDEGIMAESYESYYEECKGRLKAETYQSYGRSPGELERQVIAKLFQPLSFQAYVRKQHVIDYLTLTLL